jgi:hypothetical protein
VSGRNQKVTTAARRVADLHVENGLFGFFAFLLLVLQGF